MRTKINVIKVRNDLTKSKSYKRRNWPKYMEKIETKSAEKLVENTSDSIKMPPAAKNLERSPKQDSLDFSSEEDGYFKVGEKIIRTIFPR